MAALLVASASGAAEPLQSIAPAELLVVAPHPDDEALIAAGVLQAAVKRHGHVAVAIVTNGDKGCDRDGYERQAESVAALAKLGVSEKDVYFLGYPDGHVAELSPAPLAGVQRRDAKGRCVAFETTWAVRGHFGADLHHGLEGASAPLSSKALESDLAALLGRLHPQDVYLPHPIDAHPDHAAVYRFVRRAIDAGTWAPKTLHRAVVHAGGCWPAADCDRPVDLHAGVAELPAPLSGYRPDEQRVTDAAQKLKVIGLYRSQLEGPIERSWLASFARPVEPFFTEQLTRDGGAWIHVAGTGDAGSSEVPLPLEACGRVRLRGARGEHRLIWNPPSLELWSSTAPDSPVFGWLLPAPPSGAWRLRFTPLPGDAAVTEVSLYGPDGFSGEAIIPERWSPSAPAEADCSDAGSRAAPRAPR